MLLNGQPITLTGFGKPIIIITEFGADTLPGVHETPPEMWTDEYQVELPRRYLDVAAQRPFMAGMHVWNFADFETGQATGRAAGVRVFLYEKGYLHAKTISIDPVQGLGCEAPLPAAVRAVHIGAWVEDPTLGRYHRFVGTLQRCMTRARAKPLEAHMGRATSRRVESIRTAGADGAWPALPLAAWRDTYDTLHRWAQLVGKTRLALAPRENHWWHTPLYVTARGLTTSPIPYGDRTFEVDFDFVDHNLVIRTGDGATRALALVPRSVADFYREYTRILDSLGLRVRLWPVPVEVEHVIPLDEDHVHASYDAESAHRFWLALAQAARVLRAFRGRFLGKSSPVHFFWGSFDLACTRFSGRRAPEHPGGVPNLADWVTREAYSHECISAGWWPGGGPVQEPAFYAYAYPGPQGLADAPVRPAAASYYPGMREFVLPYDAVRTADQPEEMLLDFLQSTYDAAADLAGWDRAALEWAGARE